MHTVLKILIAQLCLITHLAFAQESWNSLRVGRDYKLIQKISINDFTINETDRLNLIIRRNLRILDLELFRIQMSSCAKPDFEKELETYNFNIDGTNQEVGIEFAKSCLIDFYVSKSDILRNGLFQRY